MIVNIFIPSLLPNEKVLRVIRSHILVLFKRLLAFVFMLLVVGFMVFLFFSLNPTLPEQNFFPLILLGLSGFSLFSWLFLFFSIIDYYLDVWVITNERVINIKQDGFFSRTVSEQRLLRVQDVTSEVHGLIGTMMHFGSVFIQSAAEKQRFALEDIPYPDEIRQLVMHLSEEQLKVHQLSFYEKK